MKNMCLSFIAGGLFFSTIIFSMGAQSNQQLIKVGQPCNECPENRFYELRKQLLSMEIDFAKFYKKPKRNVGNRLRRDLDKLKYLTEDIQREVYDIQKDRKSFIGRK